MEYQEKSKDELIAELNDIQQKYKALSALYDSDIGDHKKTKEALHASQYLVNSIISGTSDAIYVKDLSGNYTLLNNAVELAVGKPREDILGKNDFSLFPESEAATIMEGDRNVMSGTGPRTYEEYVTVADGSKAMFLSTKGPLFDINGSLIGIFGIVKNITERKISEEKIRESEEKYRLLADNVTDMISLHSTEGKYLYVSPSCKKLLGYEPVELIGLNPYTLYHPEDVKEIMNVYNSLLEHSDNYLISYRIKNKNGQYKLLETNNKTIRDDITGEALQILCISRDISERAKAVNALKQSEEKFRKAFFTNPDSITINRLDNGLYVSVNKGFTQVLGYNEDEVIEKTSIELNIWENSYCRIDFTNKLKNLGFVENLEAKLRTKSGKIIDTLVSSVLIELEGITHILSITKDITERKQIEDELIKAKDKAEESDRLKTAFLQNMSHEIRTPMNSIIGFSDLLKDNFDNKAKLSKFTEIISRRSNDLLEIINDILDIAKIESGQLPINMEECNLNELFDELTIFYNEYKKRIDKQNINFNMQCQCGTKNIVIITDKNKLKQIFNNLIINAFKFTNQGKIDGGCKMDKNNNIVFYVSDTGIGIPSDKYELIFNRFSQLNQTPNKAISGTGLGLSIVKGLINLLGGEITLESEPGKGSVFSFNIGYKKIDTIHNDLLETEGIKENYFYNQTILIVEDEYYNAEYLKEIFSDTQLTILYAENGNEATKIAIEQDVDLVLMDIRLPDMNGYEATRQILSQKPHLKIIAQTAYASQNEKQNAINAGCIDYISKPTKQAALLNMVSKYLK